MKKWQTWYIIDEDENKIITSVFGTREEAQMLLDVLKEARKPGDDCYWNTWSLFTRWAA
jgi:hypothetical protein